MDAKKLFEVSALFLGVLPPEKGLVLDFLHLADGLFSGFHALAPFLRRPMWEQVFLYFLCFAVTVVRLALAEVFLYCILFSTEKSMHKEYRKFISDIWGEI